MSISPFPDPEFAKLEKWQSREIKKMLQEDAGRDYAVKLGRSIIQQGTKLLLPHFMVMADSMSEPAHARSFNRGACLGLAFVALKSDVAMTDDQLYAHLYTLNDFTKEDESYVAAAIRLGRTTLELDPVMASCADSVTQAHPSSAYNPAVLRAGVGYAEVLAERVFRPLDELPAESIEVLNSQYAEELSGIFDNIE